MTAVAPRRHLRDIARFGFTGFHGSVAASLAVAAAVAVATLADAALIGRARRSKP